MSSTVLATWLFTELGALALSWGAKGFVGVLKDKKARQDLADACSDAIEAAAQAAPELREDLTSETFVGKAILPTIRALLADPSQLAREEALARDFINIFVKQWIGENETVDDTLARVFRADRNVLDEAFTAFFKELKSGLYRSPHWREMQHAITSEVTLETLNVLRREVSLAAGQRSGRAIEVEEAIANAAEASAGLRNWQTEIEGKHIINPARERVLERIRSEPHGTTLLVGEAGSGKSALLATLFDELESLGIRPFGIKADQIPAAAGSMNDVAEALGLEDRLEERIIALAREGPVVLLVDQLDAVSAIMDHQTQRMNLLLRLISSVQNATRRADLELHVVVSSRPFEAQHDPRFAQLKATEIRLGMLPLEAVEEFLSEIGIPPGSLSPELRESLRRPFALKLFADLARRGEDLERLTGSELLERWLATADLGRGEEAKETLDFLETLAKEMVETETLWRPADRFDLDYRDAVRRAEACGLIVRADGRLSFSHQAWLDDFQAKAFRSGTDLAEFAIERQDTLFIRTTVLRGLQRLRAVDRGAYARACNALLGDDRTRRHLRHLLAEVFGSAMEPIDLEVGWIANWIAEDPSLAGRALGHVAPNWATWREPLGRHLPAMMQNPALEWHAAKLLIEEVKIDPQNGARLVLRYWQDESFDLRAFDVIQATGELSHGLEERARQSIERRNADPYVMGQLLTNLHERGSYQDAASLLACWANALENLEGDQASIYELEKLVEQAPLEYLEALLPFFLEVVRQNVGEVLNGTAVFPRSGSLPYDWSYRDRKDTIFGALVLAVRRAMQESPTTAWSLLKEAATIEIDQVQELVADGLMAAGKELADETAKFLLSDERRLSISEVHVNGSDGIGRTIQGWHSRQLVSVVADNCSDEQVSRLRDAIEAYDRYDRISLKKESLEFARNSLAWNEDARLGLLSGLAARTLSSTRRRQVQEWEQAQTPIEGAPNTIGMARTVGSPMSADAMAKASNDAIMGMLNKLHDRAVVEAEKRSWSRTGGLSELAWAFGEFGKRDPDRAIEIATKNFQPGLHETAAGRLVGALSEIENFDPARILDLIMTFSADGFSQPEWQNSSAHALRNIASRLNGLSDEVLNLLESWIDDDAEAIEKRIASREEADRRNARFQSVGARQQERAPEPFLFGPRDSWRALPGDNYTIFSAIFAGMTSRDETDWNQGLAFLERHLARAEDPMIWASLLEHYGGALSHCEIERVNALLQGILDKYPGAFDYPGLASVLWSLRMPIDPDLFSSIMDRWLSSPMAELRQTAAELVTGAILVDPDEHRFPDCFASVEMADAAIERGTLFTAVSAWRETNVKIRERAHLMLLEAIPEVDGDGAKAIARIFPRRRQLPADTMTSELLQAISKSPQVLRACLGYSFYEALRDLLLYPKWADTVLEICERAFSALAEELESQSLGHSATELVGLTIALQRSGGSTRSRAMDLYEKLLDARVYGAEKAAKDASRA
ncbi:ATP-binding protein [Aurantiacibacter hainanensis]|uniref:ATP-binding protein n=1 Tax=Aurantiacibacter hainanensis TaxID=3076114 RepID=UPI0030C6B611